MSPGGSVADCADVASTAKYEYANFGRLDVSQPSVVAVEMLTATKALADRQCTSDECKTGYAPEPHTKFVVSSGQRLYFVHPGTGIGWECDITASSPVWVRNVGSAEGRSNTAVNFVEVGVSL